MIIYTDGSCKKNKRVEDSSKQPEGGIGIFIEENNPFNLSESFSLYPVTNIRTELYACIKACEIFIENFYQKEQIKQLEQIKQTTQIKEEENNSLIIYTDSQFTINAITKWCKNWKKKNWKKTNGDDVLNVDLIRCLDKYYCSYPITFQHIKAHQKEPVNKESDDYKHWYGNMMADKLATQN